MNCDPNSLSKASSCIRCLTDAQLMLAKTFLLCRIANNGLGGTPNTPSNLDITPLSIATNINLTWTNNTPMGSTNEIWRSTDGTTFSLFATVAGSATTVQDASGLAVGTFYYYKIRSCRSGSCSAFSSVISCCNQYTSPNVVSISFPTLIRAFGTNVDSFKAVNLAALTSVSLPALKIVDGSLDISTNANLTSITLTALKTVGSGFLLGNNNITGAFSVPAMTSVLVDFQLQGNTLLTSISAPLVNQVGGILVASGCTSLTALTFTALQTVGANTGIGRCDFNGCTALPSVTFPALTSVGGITDFHGNTSMTSISLPSLVSTGNDGITEVDVSGSTILATWNAPNWLPSDSGSILQFSTCALNAASVNQILARGVASGCTTEDFELAAGTNAAPSGQGVADKATLIGRGNTVITN